MEPRTLERMLRREGIEVTPNRLYSIMEFRTAITGDKHAAEVENLQLDAKRKAREEKEAIGELVKFEEMLQLFTNHLLIPLRQRLDSAKATNMARPEWVDETIRFLRDSIPDPKQ